jgi:hypothetical protein
MDKYSKKVATLTSFCYNYNRKSGEDKNCGKYNK